MYEKTSNIGHATNIIAISKNLMLLYPANPTIAPIKADAAIVSENRANPSRCSLLNLLFIHNHIIKKAPYFRTALF
jgi:hypothetical protein